MRKHAKTALCAGTVVQEESAPQGLSNSAPEARGLHCTPTWLTECLSVKLL